MHAATRDSAWPLFMVTDVAPTDVHIGMELGRLVQQTRVQRGMSQKELAAVSWVGVVSEVWSEYRVCT